MSGMKRVYEELIQIEHEIAEIEDQIKEVYKYEEGTIERKLKVARMQIELGKRAQKLLDLNERLTKGD